MPNLTYQIIHFIYSLGLTLWFGGLFFAMFVLAPAVMTTVRDRKLIGDIISRNTDLMRSINMVVVPLTIIASFLLYEMYKTPTFLAKSQNMLVILMGLIFFYGVWIVTPRRKAVRARIHEEGIDPEEKVKLEKEFDDLHKTSLNVATGQFMIGIVVIFLS